MVRKEQVLDGLMAFIEAELLPALGGWKAWIASAAMVQMYRSAGTVLPTLLESKVVASLGLTTANGMVDVDAAIDALKETARKRGKLEVEIPLLGTFRFDESDFDSLARHITGSGA